MPLRSVTRPPRALGALMLALALTACGDQQIPTETLPSPPAATRTAMPGAPVTLASSATPSLAVTPSSAVITQGRGVPHRAVVLDPLNARQAGARIVWSSSNPAVATVSSTGQVRAVSPGTATITATALERQISATSQITVLRQSGCDFPTPVPGNVTGHIAPIPPGYEDAPMIFRLDVGDPDRCNRYTFRLTELPVAGTMYQVANDGTFGAPITSTGAVVSNVEGWLAYVPKPDYNGVDAFRYDVTDKNGGTYQFFNQVALWLEPVNDPPTAVAQTYVGSNMYQLTNIGLIYGDRDFVTPQVCIAEVPRAGDLYWGFVDPANRVVVGECRTQQSLRYVSRANGIFGCGRVPAKSTYPHNDGFRWYAFDGRASSDTVTSPIRIDYENNPPVYGGLARVATSEDTPVLFSPGGSDPDGDAIYIMIHARPQHGTLWRTVNGLPDNEIQSYPTLFLGDADGKTTLQYVPDANFNTAGQTEEVVVSLSDGSLAAPCVQTIKVDVAPVNDAPVVSAPTSFTSFVQNGLSIFNFGASVSDDARPTDLLALTVRGSGAASHRVEGGTPAGVALTRINDNEFRYTGTLTQLNSILRFLTWHGNAFAVGTGELAIIVDDLGSFGAGGSKVTTHLTQLYIGPLIEEKRRGGSPTSVTDTATRRPPLDRR